MKSSPARLNRARTFILWALAVVWFAEMALWGLRPLSEMWTRFWGSSLPTIRNSRWDSTSPTPYATVRHAVAAANTLHAALLCMLPLLALEAGPRCATSSLLIYSVPLLGGWLVYVSLWYRATPTRRLYVAHPAASTNSTSS